jgi:hypothetical protein
MTRHDTKNILPCTDNKIIFKIYVFKYPWLLTTIHTFFSFLGSQAVLPLLSLPPQETQQTTTLSPSLLAFSLLYTVNIAVSNISMNLVSLPLHQILRSTNPALTLFLERVFFGKRVSSATISSLIFVRGSFNISSSHDFLLTCIHNPPLIPYLVLIPKLILFPSHQFIKKICKIYIGHLWSLPRNLRRH